MRFASKGMRGAMAKINLLDYQTGNLTKMKKKEKKILKDNMRYTRERKGEKERRRRIVSRGGRRR